ncbi:MAG: rhomboid family intramembrane serine protease [Caldilineaceae bacterium]
MSEYQQSADLPSGRPPEGTVTTPPFPERPQFYIARVPPTWTRILLGCNIAVFVAMIIYGFVVYQDWNGTENPYVLIFFGAKVNQLVAAGEVWRLFTAMFIHIGVIHLLFNLYALNILGPLVEGFFGHRRFLFIYVIGGLWGSVASYAFSPALSAGASGAIFGLVGATTVYFLRYRENFGARGRAIVQNMVIVIAINLFLGLSSPGIDNWGHMGGLIGGAIIGYGLIPVYAAPSIIQLGRQPLAEEQRTTTEALWIIGHIALLWFSIQMITNNLLG